MSATLLKVDGVDVSLGRRHAVPILHDVSLSVRAGEIVGLIGETGSGKTTLARTVLGLIEPTAGTIDVAGTTTSSLRGRALRDFRRGGAVQFVFQDPLRSLDPDLRVSAIVGEALAIRGEHDAAAIETRVRVALDQVGLPPTLADRHPAQLSGGQRQRVAIARALAGGPRLLVCDEPVSALDASSRNQILRLLDELRSKLDIGILVISHDLSSLAGVADRIAVMYRGRILEDGPTADVLQRPAQPYTALLVASAPSVRHAGADHPPALAPTQLTRDGDPVLAATVQACSFVGRCPFATAECAAAPELTDDGAGRHVACHHRDTWRASLASGAAGRAGGAVDPRPLVVAGTDR